MRVLRVAVEKKRWDLVAHTLVLASASLLSNGDKPQGGDRVPSNSGLRKSGMKSLIKTGEKRT